MIEPTIPENECDRQAALEKYKILDTLPERSYDDITALMAHVCKVPISLVGLIDQDRNWIKSHHGIDLSESPRKLSFCGHAIASQQDIFIVEDARLDARFADNPIVTDLGAVGYAGVPLVDADGFALGTLCVFNNEPMLLDESQKSALRNMSRQVMYLFERHLREKQLERAGRKLEEQIIELKRFASVLTHDIKAPVTNMEALVDLIKEDAGQILSGEVLAYLGHLKTSSSTLRSYVDGMLEHYLSDNLLENRPESFELKELSNSLNQLIVKDNETTLLFPESSEQIFAPRAALQQVLLNLVSNAVKYSTGDRPEVRISFNKDEKGYHFSVTDNGPGISPEKQKTIFELFETTDNVARDGSRGTGIGLATVSRILEGLGSSISLKSEVGCGSTFSFTLPDSTVKHTLPLAA